MACRHCGATEATYKANTRPTAAGMVSARHHADEAAEDFKEGDILGGLRHVVQPFLGPLASKAAEKVVETFCLKCGKRL